MRKVIVLILVIVFTFIGIKLLKSDKDTNINTNMNTPVTESGYTSDPGVVVPEKIYASLAEEFFYYNGWVYYADYEFNSGGIYKMKPNGTEKTLVYQGEENADKLCIYNDYIYFGRYNICRVKIDGTDFRELYHMDYSTDCIMVMDDMVFFIDETESNSYNYGTYICSINLDGTNYQRWTDEDGFSRFYLNGYDLYYYSKKIEGMKVFNLNTRTETTLSNIYTTPIVAENKLYFSNKTTNTLNECDINTGVQRQLYSVDGKYPEICGIHNGNLITIDSESDYPENKGKIYSSPLNAPENRTIIFSEDNTGMAHYSQNSFCIVGEYLYISRYPESEGSINNSYWYALNLNTYEIIPLEIKDY